MSNPHHLYQSVLHIDLLLTTGVTIVGILERQRTKVIGLWDKTTGTLTEPLVEGRKKPGDWLA